MSTSTDQERARPSYADLVLTVTELAAAVEAIADGRLSDGDAGYAEAVALARSLLGPEADGSAIAGRAATGRDRDVRALIAAIAADVTEVSAHA